MRTGTARIDQHVSPPAPSPKPRDVIRFMRRDSGGTKANQFVRQLPDVPSPPSQAELPSLGVSSLDCAGAEYAACPAPLFRGGAA